MIPVKPEVDICSFKYCLYNYCNNNNNLISKTIIIIIKNITIIDLNISELL